MGGSFGKAQKVERENCVLGDGRRGNKVYGATGLEGHLEAFQLLGIRSSTIKRGLSLLPVSPLPVAVSRLPFAWGGRTVRA